MPEDNAPVYLGQFVELPPRAIVAYVLGVERR